ncbi:MAG: hypothetical protein ACP5OG_03465 [Candidatus Nanoarchaeia archaeon]
MKTIKSKLAQQEIMGFILIVVIVSVIGIIALTLSIGKTQNVIDSKEISSFLSASMYYTSDCALDYIPRYKALSDLAGACLDSNKICLNENYSCSVLNSTYKRIINESFNIKEGSQNKAYKMDIYFQARNSSEQPKYITQLSEGNFGNCSKIIGADQYLDFQSGEKGIIHFNLEICKAK